MMGRACAVLGVGLMSLAPRWEQTAQDDDIRFLPGRCDSVKGYRLLEQAFPNDVYASRVIFALERNNSRLTPHDFALANQIVVDLTQLSEREPGLKIGRIHSNQDAFVGKRMLSRDNQCLLIQVSLGTPYLAFQTCNSVIRAEEVVRERLSKAGPDVPELYVTGPAGVGRDLIASIEEYLNAHNAGPSPYVWTATAESILAKVQRARTKLQQVVSQN
jgi:hypothetical protein